MRVISPSEVRSIVGQMMRDCDSCIGGVLFLKSDVVDTPAYLRCLWDLVLASCPAAAWKCDRVSTASMAGLSKRFDAVVVAAGPGVPSLWADGSASALPFNYVRGQNILYRQDSQRTVSSPMLCGEYIIPSADGLTITCGSTQEHINELGVLDELEPAPCLDTATKLLRERLLHLCPVLPASLTVSDCKAGVRVVAKRCNLGRVPKISRHRLLPNAWLLTGFGSRGLVHHAFAADQLVRAVLAGHTDSVPPEMIIH